MDKFLTDNSAEMLSVSGGRRGSNRRRKIVSYRRIVSTDRIGFWPDIHW